VALTVAGALVVGEVAARVLVAAAGDEGLRALVQDYRRVAHGGSKGFTAAPYTSFALQPRYTGHAPGDPVRHNARGFREADETPAKKVPGTRRVICLGGSTTYGSGVRDNALTYPAQLEGALNRTSVAREGPPPFEVLNLGVGNYTSAEVLTALHFRALPLEPDVVVIQVAINDVRPRFHDDFDLGYAHFRTPYRDVAPGPVTRLAYRSTLFVSLAWLAGAVEPLTLQALTERPHPPADRAALNLERNGAEAYRRNLRACIDLARAAGARVVLLTEPYFVTPDLEARAGDAERAHLERLYQRGLAQHNDVVRALAASHGAGLVDLDRETPRVPSFFTDPVHMTGEGNRWKAERIARALREELERR